MWNWKIGEQKRRKTKKRAKRNIERTMKKKVKVKREKES